VGAREVNMCGIAAAFYPMPVVESGEIIRSMLGTIKHRGELCYFGEFAVLPQAHLGCNRLAIVDEPDGKQPIWNEERTICAVFNGEIYNHREIRADLEKLGHVFTSQCDTELLVHGFEEWGESLPERLNGMFAFVLWDDRAKESYAARDPIGIKPLYHAHGTDSVLYFASEIKALAHLPLVNDVEFVPPGCYMYRGQIRSYNWRNDVDLTGLSESLIANQLKICLGRSVARHVDTPLPVAVFFGAGVDSTLVLSLVQEYHSDVTAIIAGTPGAPDRVAAEHYCRLNGNAYRIIEPPSEQELFQKHIREIIAICESFEPNTVRQSAISYYISKAASDFKVAMCGEGADELFAGYPEMAAHCADTGQMSLVIDRFLSDLHRTQLQRVDRTAMHFTLEVRVPFLDREVLSLGMSIPPELKITRREGATVTKHILRESAVGVIPENLRTREKVVLSEGAGFKGNQQVGGLFFDLASNEIGDMEFCRMQKDHPEWALANKEEAFYFSIFRDLGYTKASFAQKRVTANQRDTVSPER
jgi:asparagine synthase (glutamine-hydrolysing)